MLHKLKIRNNKREPFIDVVIGPQSYHKINKILENFKNNKKEDETEFDTIAKFDFVEKKKILIKISTFLTIQEGCDKFCHFCCTLTLGVPNVLDLLKQ